MKDIDNFLSSFTFDGELYLAIHPLLKLIYFDYTGQPEVTKSFFCDFSGNIICPGQVNNLLKRVSSRKKYSYFFYNKLQVILLNNFFRIDDNSSSNLYLRLNIARADCIMKIIYSCKNFSLGVIENQLNRDVSECLNLIPQNLRDWKKMLVDGDSIQLIMD